MSQNLTPARPGYPAVVLLAGILGGLIAGGAAGFVAGRISVTPAATSPSATAAVTPPTASKNQGWDENELVGYLIGGGADVRLVRHDGMAYLLTAGKLPGAAGADVAARHQAGDPDVARVVRCESLTAAVEEGDRLRAGGTKVWRWQFFVFASGDPEAGVVKAARGVLAPR